MSVYVKLGRFWNCNLCAQEFANCNRVIATYFIYLFINYNTITIYILIMHELSKFYHVLGVMSQTRVSSAIAHDPHANSLAHYPLDY